MFNRDFTAVKLLPSEKIWRRKHVFRTVLPITTHDSGKICTKCEVVVRHEYWPDCHFDFSFKKSWSSVKSFERKLWKNELFKYNSAAGSGADPDHVQHSIRLGKNFLKINSKINLSCGGPVLLNPNALLPHPLLAPKSKTPSFARPYVLRLCPTTAKCLIYRHLA